MSEPEAIATIRAALARIIDDYDGTGINAETTKQTSAALTASNVLVLLRAYDAAQAPQAAEHCDQIGIAREQRKTAAQKQATK